MHAWGGVVAGAGGHLSHTQPGWYVHCNIKVQPQVAVVFFFLTQGSYFFSLDH